jgi:hypothetical protein
MPGINAVCCDEAMGSTWSYLDITALGRQEEWEDSPDGFRQTLALPVVEPARRVRRGCVITCLAAGVRFTAPWCTG